MESSYFMGIAVAGLILLVFSFNHACRASLLPPGPQGTFFSGIQHQLPAIEPWKTYAQWSKDFQSPIIAFRVYNQIIIVLNDVQSVRTLLNQRSHIYSDRPMSWMLNVICGRGKAIFNVSSSDPRHRVYRQLFQSEVGDRATKRYWPMMKDEVKILSDGFTGAPGEWEYHIVRNFTSLIMKLAFGYGIESLNDPFIQITEETAKISGWATAPGRWLVDYYPILRFVPPFFPGAEWKRQGHRWKERLRSLSQVPHNWVKEQMKKERYEPSFTSRLLDREAEIGTIGSPFDTVKYEDIIQWCAGGLYAGATHTTISALTSFVLLMALHPEAQKKAQKELDDVLDQDGHPEDILDPEKLGHLEYLNSILKEVLRFAPIGNIGLPHRLTVDDEYAGFHLPKGATVIGNIWAIMHDPELYPEPFKFCPERFTSEAKGLFGASAQPDSRQFAYGFGRRSCPGTHFAEAALLLAMACILARFHIIEAPNEVSKAGIHRTPEFTSGITSCIKPFPIIITPRAQPTLET